MNVPITRPSCEMPCFSNRKTSCILTISSSIPVISVRWVTRRLPSLMRATWIKIVIAEAICLRTAFSGRFRLAMRAIVSIRATASRGLFAWTVVKEPSWPVFMACNISNASSPRTSPTTIRSGRIRRLLITSCRCLIAPVPSTFAGRHSSRTTCRCFMISSAESSMVTIRSLSEM